MEADLDQSITGAQTKHTVSFHLLKKTNPSERVGRFGRPLSGLLSEDHARLEEHLVFYSPVAGRKSDQNKSATSALTVTAATVLR